MKKKKQNIKKNAKYILYSICKYLVWVWFSSDTSFVQEIEK